MSTAGPWDPPALTEEERLAIQAKQKERELLSNSMGQYLLKGYRMLGSNCTECGNILLKPPREDADYCIYCQELKQGDKTSPSTTQPQSQHKETTNTQPTVTKAPEVSVPATATNKIEPWSRIEETLLLKIKWATNELSQTASVEYSTQLCVLIREAIDAVGKLRNL